MAVAMWRFVAGSSAGDAEALCFVLSSTSQAKSRLYPPVYKKHKAKIKCARAAGAGKMPELLRTEVQLGRGNHHPTARCESSLYYACGRAVGPQVPEDPLADRVFSSVSDSHTSLR